MKKQQTLFVCLAITALVLGAAGQASGQAPFDELIVFGDSLSDTGNVFISFGAPPSPITTVTTTATAERSGSPAVCYARR